jgi:hypothetical protein
MLCHCRYCCCDCQILFSKTYIEILSTCPWEMSMTSATSSSNFTSLRFAKHNNQGKETIGTITYQPPSVSQQQQLQSHIMATESNYELLASACFFLGTSALFAYHQRRAASKPLPSRRNFGSTQKSVSFSSPLTSVYLSKEEVLELRQKRFCKQVSVSYSNTGGLMMVGVRCVGR